MLYYFKKGKNATEMQKKICAVYGEGPVTDWMCQKGFMKFCTRDFLLEDAPVVDQLKLMTMQLRHWEKQCYMMQEIADVLKISKSSVENHLHQHGYVNHFDIWVRLKLKPKEPSWSYFHIWFSIEM